MGGEAEHDDCNSKSWGDSHSSLHLNEMELYSRTPDLFKNHETGMLGRQNVMASERNPRQESELSAKLLTSTGNLLASKTNGWSFFWCLFFGCPFFWWVAGVG